MRMNKEKFISLLNNIIEENKTQKLDEIFQENFQFSYLKRLKFVKWTFESKLLFEEAVPLSNYWKQIADVYMDLRDREKNLVLKAIRQLKVTNDEMTNSILKILKKEADEFNINFPLRVNRILPKWIVTNLIVKNRHCADWLGIGIANLLKSKYDDSLFYLLNIKDLDNDNFNFGDEVSEYLKITLQFHLNPFTVNYAISEMMRDKKLKLLYDILKFQYLNKNTLAVLLEHKTIQKLLINVGLERELSSYELGILKEKINYNFKFYGPEFVKFAKKYSIKLPSTIEYIDGIHMIDISSEGKLSWKFNTPSDAEMTFKKICTENNQLEIENYRTLLLKHLNDKNIKTFAKVKLIKAFFDSSELSPFIDSIKEYISKNLDSDKEIFNLAQYISLNGNYKKFTYADYDLFIALIKYKENKNIYSKILSINYSELPISNNFIDKQYVDFNVFFNCDLGRYFEVLKTMLEKRKMEDNNLINRMENLRLVNSAYRDFIIGRLWNYLGNTNYSVSANTLLGYSTAFSSFAPNDLKKFSDAAICLLNSNYNSASQSPYTAFNIALVLSDEIEPSIEVFSTNFNYDILRSLLEIFFFYKRKYLGSWLDKFSHLPRFPEICVSIALTYFEKIKVEKLSKIITYIERAASTQKGLIDISKFYSLKFKNLDDAHFEVLLQLTRVLIAKKYIVYSIMMESNLKYITEKVKSDKKIKFINLFKNLLLKDEYEDLIK